MTKREDRAEALRELLSWIETSATMSDSLAAQRIAKRIRWMMTDDEQAAFPMQPVVLDARGVARFKANPIVQHLLEHGNIDMNAIGMFGFPREAREQFAQLIGYSVRGASELEYVSDAAIDAANAEARRLLGQAAERTEPGGGECVDCRGEGYLDRDDGQQRCPACDGSGRAR
jgi:hypothetical protein